MIWLAILWVCEYIRNKPLLMISLIVMLVCLAIYFVYLGYIDGCVSYNYIREVIMYTLRHKKGSRWEPFLRMMLLWTPQSIFFRRFKMGGFAGCDYACFFWESAIADKLHGFGKNNICGEIPIV